MVAAFSLVDVSEDCNALLLLDASLEDSSDTALDELSVYQEVEDGLGP